MMMMITMMMIIIWVLSSSEGCRSARRTHVSTPCDPERVFFIKATFTLYRITFDPIQKCSLFFVFKLCGYSFGAVQVQNRSSFPAGTKLYLIAGTKLYLIAGTKLYRITVSNVNAWLIRNTFVSDQKLMLYSVNAA